ncbi:MAG: thioredoxin domain-containing protein [Thermotogae bacterium]|nr:thioredoxin domain-containing protein [Thermotogota bacterium]
MFPLLLAQQVDVKALTEGREPVMGVKDAPVVIVMFTDPDCPYCRMTHKNLFTFAQGRKDVALYIRFFPLRTIHPYAQQKAEVLACTPKEYLPTVFSIMEEHSPREPFDWTWIARLDEKTVKKIKRCVESGKGKRIVEEDFRLGFKYGVQGTPTFFINGQKHVGAMRSPEDVEKVVRHYTGQ